VKPPNPKATPRRAAMTRSQRQVVELLATGMPVAEIADELQIAERSAHGVLNYARKRMGAKSNAHLVAMAIERGLIEAPPAPAGAAVPPGREAACG
jgi:DNA-binding CsgD family transcriptional regulator